MVEGSRFWSTLASQWTTVYIYISYTLNGQAQKKKKKEKKNNNKSKKAAAYFKAVHFP